MRRYLARRADLTSRPLVTRSADNVRQIVVIPVLAEADFLLDTLDSLARNPADQLARTLTICVVNNGEAAAAPPDWLAQNRRVLGFLDDAVAGKPSPIPHALRMAYVDASSPGRELPPGGGVGLARKIGMDFAAAVLDAQDGGNILSLDADTTVDPDYLEAVEAVLSGPGAWAATVAYAHPLDGPPEVAAAITAYEIYMRCHVIGLRHAASPYAFHAIGSAMACTAEAYAAVSGMNRRRGGEDFYFLQELAKTGQVIPVNNTTVHPSARVSARVPFGTGPRMARLLDGREPQLLHAPASYETIRRLFETVQAHLDSDGAALRQGIATLHPAVGAFMDAANLEHVWNRLRANSRGGVQLHRQFDRWFDGLRTLRALHWLRDHGFPDEPLSEAAPRLLALAGLPLPNLDSVAMQGDAARQKALLLHLRSIEDALL